MSSPEDSPRAPSPAISNPDSQPSTSTSTSAKPRVSAPYASDRVFPIRSMVNVEPVPGSPGAGSNASHAASCKGSTAGTPVAEEPYFNLSRAGSSTEGWKYLGSISEPSDGAPSTYTTADEAFPLEPGADEEGSARSESQGFYTVRHRHITSEEGHMVIVGVAGSERMQRCEDEPIHIPGAVQGFGCLVALREQQDDGILDIRIVSENSQEIIGYTPAELFEIGNFLEILSEEQAGDFMDHLEFVREAVSPRIDGPEVFSLVINSPNNVPIKLWCAVHIPEANPDLYLCEFELENDDKYPLTSAYDGSHSPTDTLASKPTHEELLESTISTNRPLRVSRSSRKRKGEAAAMEVFSLMSQIQEQLASATDLGTFLKIVVGLTKELTGFHRVMIYQFDEAWNGRVVVELVDPSTTKDLYKGLNFPATDIPAQARALYQLNKVRLLYDREQETARLVCKTQADLGAPVDLTHSYLRAMSPIHVKYLGNMGVRASMSISITAFDQLWGLISCHSYGSKGMRVSFPIRKMCRLIGETASRNIERLSYARRLHARKLINTVPTEQNPSGYIVASSDDLLKLFDADCGLLSIRGETKVLGKLDNSQEGLALLEYLRIKNFPTVITSQDLSTDFPDLSYEPGFQVIAGLLVVPLSSDNDFIVFLRKPQLKHVHWAGNPYDKKTRGDTGYLEPRTSFKIWSETVVGRSREWTEEQVETAAVLCLVYGKFIEVWRQKEAALRNSRLTRLLLANASHEVRTPLNAIINYLEIALESPLDAETRENLARSHSASKSLIYVINDLLDLTRTEEGQTLVKDEIFDLKQVVYEATRMFKSDSERKGLTFEIIEYPGLPQKVQGDPSRLRQIVSNITANAVRHTATGGLKIEVWVDNVETDKCDIEIAVEDTGEGIPQDKVDMLFREFEQVHTEDEPDYLTGAQQESASFNALSKIPGQKVLGLGLAVVARSIRNMKGKLRLLSEPGKGSRFTISLPFSLPSSQVLAETEQEPESNPKAKGAASESPPPQPAGEVTLIHPQEGFFQSKSPTSSIGAQSTRIDRIVSAISSPPSTGSAHMATEYFSSGPNSAATVTYTSPGGSAGSTLKAPAHERLSQEGALTPGQEFIGSSVAPIKPVKLYYEGVPVPHGAVVPLPPSVPQAQAGPSTTTPTFNVLVAEDDPINKKIIQKRLEKMGHVVDVTTNGEECYEQFIEYCARYDAILMDMQMPIMDGGASASKIREFESKLKQPIPVRHPTHGRIPIFAVSASLVEEKWMEYLRLGFDGWILKPIDFRRLQILLEGTKDPSIRKNAKYIPGLWEQGGWFLGSPVNEVENRVLSAAAEAVVEPDVVDTL